MNNQEIIPPPTIPPPPPSNDEDEPDNPPQVNPIAATTTTTTTSRVARAVRPIIRGRRNGAGTYHMAERCNFLRIMLEVLPIGPDQWAEVASRYSVNFPGREADSIRRKYNELHKKNVPSGDPNIPEDIQLARRVKYEIGIKADVCGDEDSYTVESNTFGNESQAVDMPPGRPTPDHEAFRLTPPPPPPTTLGQDHRQIRLLTSCRCSRCRCCKRQLSGVKTDVTRRRIGRL